jgi:cell division protein FtsB
MSKTKMFKEDTENVLVRGLNSMTRACDALSDQNKRLNQDIEKLKAKVARLQDKVLVESEERE